MAGKRSNLCQSWPIPLHTNCTYVDALPITQLETIVKCIGNLLSKFANQFIQGFVSQFFPRIDPREHDTPKNPGGDRASSHVTSWLFRRGFSFSCPLSHQRVNLNDHHAVLFQCLTFITMNCNGYTTTFVSFMNCKNWMVRLEAPPLVPKTRTDFHDFPGTGYPICHSCLSNGRS